MAITIKKRDRSPKFPYITLTVALERIGALYGSAKNNWVRLSDAADDWNLSPTSSSTLRNAAALLGYGLIEDDNTGDVRRIRLTENAQRIVGDTRPGVREALLEEAALSPAVVREYYKKWGKDRPNDQHAVSTLIYDSDFTVRAAKTFLNVYDDAVGYLFKQVADDALPEAETDQTPNEEGLSQSQIEAQEGALGEEPQTPSPKESSPTVSKTQSVTPAQIAKEDWLKSKIAKDVTVSITVSGEMDSKMLKRLIRLLETQLEIMEDD